MNITLLSQRYRISIPQGFGRNSSIASELVRRIENRLGSRDTVVHGDYEGTWLTLTVPAFKGETLPVSGISASVTKTLMELEGSL